MQYADFSTAPPYYNNSSSSSSIRFDNGQGIPKLSVEHMTQEDVLRSSFLLSQDTHRPENVFIKESHKGLGSDTEVSKIFFSDRNIKRVQKLLKQAVLECSKGKFKLEVDQEEKDIITVMAAVYRLNARFTDKYPVRQVKKLNNETVKYMLPDVITNIKQYYGYLHEINTPLKTLPRPMNVNNAGRKTLPSVTTSWGYK